MFKDHLNWMKENQPELLASLHWDSQLENHLNKVVSQARRVREATFPRFGANTAQELAYQVISPPDGPALTQDPAPKPVGQELSQQLNQWLQKLSLTNKRTIG